MSTLLVSTVKDPAGGSTITVPTSGTFTLAPPPVLGTEQATTSGTSKDFTGIAAGTKRITVMFEGVSTASTSAFAVQLGDAGGIETSGYVGASTGAGGASPTTAFQMAYALTAARNYSGALTLSLKDASAFTWVASGVSGQDTGGVVLITGGVKSLSAVLTQIRVTTIAGDEAFDAGSINIMTEG